MHVVELLLPLRPRVHVEIIIAALPEAAEFPTSLWKTQHELPRALAFSGAQGAGDSLLETLDDLGRTSVAGLAQKQVHMLGHENVAHEGEAVAQPRLLEGANGQIAGPDGVQKRPALVATKGDEMKIAKTGDASEIFRHRREEGPTLSKTERVGHPGGGVYYVLPTLYK